MWTSSVCLASQSLPTWKSVLTQRAQTPVSEMTKSLFRWLTLSKETKAAGALNSEEHQRAGARASSLWNNRSVLRVCVCACLSACSRSQQNTPVKKWSTLGELLPLPLTRLASLWKAPSWRCHYTSGWQHKDIIQPPSWMMLICSPLWSLVVVAQETSKKPKKKKRDKNNKQTAGSLLIRDSPPLLPHIIFSLFFLIINTTQSFRAVIVTVGEMRPYLCFSLFVSLRALKLNRHVTASVLQKWLSAVAENNCNKSTANWKWRIQSQYAFPFFFFLRFAFQVAGALNKQWIRCWLVVFSCS